VSDTTGDAIITESPYNNKKRKKGYINIRTE